MSDNPPSDEGGGKTAGFVGGREQLKNGTNYLSLSLLLCKIQLPRQREPRTIGNKDFARSDI